MSPHDVDLSLFRASLARAVASADFYRRFYERFMAASPEIAKLFHDRDMRRIEAKLRMTLEMVEGNAAEQPGMGMYLELLGRIHRAIGVSGRHFALWRIAAVNTAAECDPEFDADARRAWEGVIDRIAQRMGIPRPGN